MKPFSTLKILAVVAMILIVASLAGCGANQATETTAKPDAVAHPASASTVATSTEAPGAFSVDEIGPTTIVDVAFVESKMTDPGYVIVDGREKKDYDAGHIPGAVHFGDGIWKVLKHTMDGRVKPADKFAKIMGEFGISNDKKVIVYGTKGDYHVTCEMSPVYYGLAEWDYMNGGYEAWVAAGKKVDTAPVTPTAAKFTAQVKNKNMYISTAQLATIVKAKDPKYYIIDTRSKDEWEGKGLQGVRAGRIPYAALNAPPDTNLDPTTKALLPTDKLAEVYKDVPKDKTIILYCHRGCRTGFAYLALRSLGYKDVRVYEDGFIVWNAWLELPVEEEHFINFRGDIKTTVDKVKEMTTPAATK